MMPLKRCRTAGFSMLELLAVLAILAILAALLFPVFSTSRRKAQDATCVANLQQISRALTLYAADYDGAYPLAVQGTFVNNHQGTNNTPLWGDLLQPYLHTAVFPACPLREMPFLMPEQAKAQSELSGIALNSFLNTPFGRQNQYILNGRQETALQHPACTITLLEARIGIYDALKPDTALSQAELTYAGYIVDAKLEFPYLDQTPGALRHHGGANYAFADGHVQWLQPMQIATTPESDGLRLGFGL